MLPFVRLMVRLSRKPRRPAICSLVKPCAIIPATSSSLGSTKLRGPAHPGAHFKDAGLYFRVNKRTTCDGILQQRQDHFRQQVIGFADVSIMTEDADVRKSR